MMGEASRLEFPLGRFLRYKLPTGPALYLALSYPRPARRAAKFQPAVRAARAFGCSGAGRPGREGAL